MKVDANEWKTLALVAIVIGLFCGLLGGWWIISALLTLPAGLMLLGRSRREANAQALEAALPALDVICRVGRRYLGKNASLAATKRLENPREAGPLQFQQLCKTQAGQWFTFQFSTHHGRACNFAVSPCSDAQASAWLEPSVLPRLPLAASIAD